jgi:hypothetical protein
MGILFWLLFSAVKAMNFFRQNKDWATFWVYFSQTHLVTLDTMGCFVEFH